jgi:hypothetical protein
MLDLTIIQAIAQSYFPQKLFAPLVWQSPYLTPVQQTLLQLFFLQTLLVTFSSADSILINFFFSAKKYF